ncbi:MAG: hypothetical protein JSU70_13960 [Phycisphaerales bacterium]|nr:MAG: hypothetical protein JSU70_13960 [Phycisphaerales bacterium]
MANPRMPAVALVLAAACLGSPVATSSAVIAVWGRLANPGFENERISATLFFPGQAKDGTRAYEWSPGSNMSLYTVHPADERHLDWAKSAANRAFALERMLSAGINVAVMSSRGEDFVPCTCLY